MIDVVVIAAEADQTLAQELASALTRAGVEAAAQMPGAAIPKTAFVLFCLTNAAPADRALVKLVWREVPMKEDPAGRFLFAVFDPVAAANENFAPFLKRHFAAAGDEPEAFAAHINKYRGELAAQVKAAQDAHERYMKEIASRPPPSERDGIGSGRAADIGASDGPMGVGSGRRVEGVGTGANPEDARRSEFLAEMYRKRAAAPAPGTVVFPRPETAAPPPLPTPQQPAKLDKIDAIAFAPKKLHRGTPELIRVSIFQPRDRGRVVKDAKLADHRTKTAGTMRLAELSRGATIGAVLEVRGAEAGEHYLFTEWRGAAINFDFSIEPSRDPDVAQALVSIRILADGAQIGAITFVRPLKPLSKKQKKEQDAGEKLRRVSRAFLSYSSDDRTTVGLIASAYQRAGIPCFFDRSSLTSGEEWSPRLRKEIERADLFHLCWSKRAAASEWVQREAEHAMTIRRARKRPEITIQMLDGPPWAPHPQSLDALNFDDYARAAMVGYQRGDASS